MVKYQPAALDRTFFALSDPTRRAILQRLAEGQATVSELAKPFDMSLPAISKHLRVLEGAGLLNRRREGRTHTLSLAVNPLRDAATWLETYRHFWEAQFSALDGYLSRFDADADES